MTRQGRRGPYVGPRAFEPGEELYGRDAETSEIRNLVIADRIVLMVSPSGAGKTSLLQSKLIPRLQDDGFDVLPIIRVGISLAVDLQEQLSDNRYLASALFSLTGGEKAARDESFQARVRGLFGRVRPSLAEVLEAVPEPSETTQTEAAEVLEPNQPPATDMGRVEEPRPQLLIFDQFEEILTLDPTDYAAKREFFEQIGNVLGHRDRWAVFALREEFLAGLEPFLRLVPTRFATTFRLDLLKRDAAIAAIRKPVEEWEVEKVEFQSRAAETLVDSLRRVRTQAPDGSIEEAQGQYVEPVQLQVVCQSIWNGRPPGALAIDTKQVSGDWSVDKALGEYYEQQVAAIANDTELSERVIREWFGQQLITEHGIRGQVFREPGETSGGLENRAIEALVDAYLVRIERRRGVTIYELAHDRLIDPVRASNARWKRNHATALQAQAELWQERDYASQYLWIDAKLDEVKRRADERPGELSQLEKNFLREATLARRTRRLKAIGMALLAVAFVAISISVILFQRGRERELTVAASVFEPRVFMQDTLLKELSGLLQFQDSISDYVSRATSASDTLTLDSTVFDTTVTQIPVVDTQPSRRNVTIAYYHDDVVSTGALKKLSAVGFRNLVYRDARVTTPTNGIAFGSQVPEDDVRLIAASLYESGIELKRVKRFDVDRGRGWEVQLYSDVALVRAPALSSIEIIRLDMLTKSGAPNDSARGLPVQPVGPEPERDLRLN